MLLVRRPEACRAAFQTIIIQVKMKRHKRSMLDAIDRYVIQAVAVRLEILPWTIAQETETGIYAARPQRAALQSKQT